MTFAEFEERYHKEMAQAQREYEEWVREEAEKEAQREAKEKEKKNNPSSILVPTSDRFSDAEFLLEQLLLATSLMTVAMHHLSYYAAAKGKHKNLDKNDQNIMQRTADEIEAFINLLEGEGISTEVNDK